MNFTKCNTKFYNYFCNDNNNLFFVELSTFVELTAALFLQFPFVLLFSRDAHVFMIKWRFVRNIFFYQTNKTFINWAPENTPNAHHFRFSIQPTRPVFTKQLTFAIEVIRQQPNQSNCCCYFYNSKRALKLP